MKNSLDLEKNKYWKASLSLEICHRFGKSVLTKCLHQGPLRIQRPFYPEGYICPHLYVLHPPGGFVAGDDIDINLHVKPQAQCLITSPAAGKFYGTKHRVEDQRQTLLLTIDQQAALEWLPQETIIFDSAKAFNHSQIRLQHDSTLFYWENLCLGRLKSGEKFNSGFIHQDIQIYCDNKLIHIEKNQLQADSALFQSSAGFNKQPVFATFFAFSQDFTKTENLARLAEIEKQLFDLSQAALQLEQPYKIAMTQKGKLLIIRFLGQNSASAQKLFIDLWHKLRPLAKQVTACPPRIWNT